MDISLCTPGFFYPSLLNVGVNTLPPGTGVPGLSDSLLPVTDGNGFLSPFSISKTAVNFNRSGPNTFQLDGIPLTVSATVLNNLSTATLNIQPTANQIQLITIDANTKRIALTDNISVVNSISIRDIQISVLGSNVISTTASSPLIFSPTGAPVRIGQDGTPINLEIRTGAELRLYSSANASYTGWKCSSGPSTVLTMPITNGNSGDTLTNAGDGTTFWSHPSVSNIQIFVDQVAHGFVVGDIIRKNGTNYVKAQADNAANAEVIGIVTQLGTIPTELFYYTICGNFYSGHVLTDGAMYFLDPVTPGAFTETAPSTSGQVIKPLFIANNSTNGVWLNQRGDLIP